MAYFASRSQDAQRHEPGCTRGIPVRLRMSRIARGRCETSEDEQEYRACNRVRAAEHLGSLTQSMPCSDAGGSDMNRGLGFAAAVLLALHAAPGHAQEAWPSRPVKF